MYYRIVPAVYSCLFIKARVNYLASDVPDRLSPPNCNPNNFLRRRAPREARANSRIGLKVQ